MFFRFGPFPGHAPAEEIIIAATCLRCKCALCRQRAIVFTDLAFIKMQKTTLAIVKQMFFVDTALFLSEQII